MAIKPVTYQGVSNFKSNLYALEVKSRFIDQSAANGYYKGYGNELAPTASSNVITIGSGAFLVQGRLNEIDTGGEAVTVTIQNGYVGYVCARIETYHPDDTENCTLVVKTGASLGAITFTRDDTYQRTAESENKVYELPLCSFSMSGGKVTNLVRVITAIEENTATRDIANEAKSTAASAVSTANTANSTANAAKSTANTAATNASNAVSTANAAKSTANTAATNASNAVSTANTAKNTADAASTNASNAVTTANAAKTAATAAQTAAEKAQAAAENADAVSYVHHLVFSGVNGDTYYNIFCDIVSKSATKITTATQLKSLIQSVYQHSCSGYVSNASDTVVQRSIPFSFSPASNSDTRFTVFYLTIPASGNGSVGSQLLYYTSITNISDFVTS